MRIDSGMILRIASRKTALVCPCRILVVSEAMRNIIPESIRTRQDKMGFVTPESQWIKHGLSDRFEIELQKAIASLGQWVQPDVLQKIFQATLDGNSGMQGVIWRVISFSRWLKVFDVKI